VTIAINHHHKHKKIIQLSAEPDAFTHQYGVELPSFAYDSSEYFISAMVERATDSYSLHVTMFLLGHNTIATDLPFESISTEEEIIYKWGHALKVNILLTVTLALILTHFFMNCRYLNRTAMLHQVIRLA
jgi:hypothetical protein